jgi:hypothetical protein
MHAEVTSSAVRFSDGSSEAGIYRLDDPFKPYLHPLRTPAGHTVTVASPADHRHHKGLMFALRCADLNFWEENPGSGICGLQRIQETLLVESEGSAAIRQFLRWEREDGALPTYEESRTISVEPGPDRSSYHWAITSERLSLRDHTLIMSEWSLEKTDGTKVNYHGLGIRLPWPWCVPYCRTLTVDGEVQKDFSAASGGTPRSVSMEGLLDGAWSPPRVQVKLSQPASQPCQLFALDAPFPYLSLGPCNLSPLEVSKGQTFTERYEIIVSDIIQTN